MSSITTCSAIWKRQRIEVKPCTRYMIFWSAVETSLALAVRGSFLATHYDFNLRISFLIVSWTAVNLADFHVIRDQIYNIPPRGLIAAEMRRGQRLRVTDLEGGQVGDLVAFAGDSLAEKLWTSNTIRLNKTIYLGAGHVLYSELSRPLLRILDTNCARHTLLAGSCNAEIETRSATASTTTEAVSRTSSTHCTRGGRAARTSPCRSTSS